MFVFLTVNVAKLDSLEVSLFNAGRAEEKSCTVVVAHELLGSIADYNRRKLIKIAKNHHLATAEWRIFAARNAKFMVYHVHNIGADHGDFINYNRVEVFVNLTTTLGDLGNRFGVAYVLNIEVEPKKRVNSLAADINSGDAGWRNDGGVFKRMRNKILQKYGFARAGFTSDEIIMGCFIKQTKNCRLFGAEFWCHMWVL